MKKQRGLFLGLALAALLGLSARDAQAGNLTITITSSGFAPISFDFTDPFFAQPGGDANHVTANIQNLNTALAGSAYSFNDLGASSNNPGSAAGANIGETGTVIQTSGGATDITIVASQTGFNIPSGPGLLSSASGGTYTNATAGDTTTVYGALDGTQTLPHDVYTADGTSPQSYSNGSGTTVPAVGSAGGYTLTSSVSILMSPSVNASDRFTASTVFTAVPEPASIVMMVTGMPLPLVVLGLLRRRRAAA
jgi:hypothetical protein